MPGNWPIFLLALAVFLLGASLAYFNKTRPNGIAHNFGLVIMVNGTLMFLGLSVFAVLSAFITIVRGH